MKIGIDTFGCGHGRSGIGSYLSSLVPCFKSSPDVNFMLYGSELDRYTYTSESDNEYKAVDIPQVLSAERIWHLINEPRFVKKQHCSAILYPAAARLLPLFYSVPSVAVVNDIASVFLNTREDIIYRLLIRFTLPRASAIIAPSNFIRDDLIKIGIKPNKIKVIHNGINHSEFYPRDVMENDVVDIKPFAIKRPYIIYASSMQGDNKKHIELIEAFEKFKKKTHLPHKLVLSGSEGPSTGVIHQAIMKSEYASDILMTGYFPHESLPELYACATACVFPSVCEGVGLPVLEAMSTGLPVTCSSSGALPEMAGENALYFDSDNTDEMASCIERIITDEALRAKLIAGGLERAKDFSWEKTAEETLLLLRKVAGL